MENITQEIINDFYRTRKDFVEQFLILAINSFQNEFGENENIEIRFISKEYGFFTRDNIKQHYKNEYIEKATEALYSLCRELSEVTFKGIRFWDLVMTTYKNNKDNEIGQYYEPLLEFYASVYDKEFKPIKKSMELYVKSFQKYTLFQSESTVYYGVKASPMICDFVDAVEKLRKQVDNDDGKIYIFFYKNLTPQMMNFAGSKRNGVLEEGSFPINKSSGWSKTIEGANIWLERQVSWECYLAFKKTPAKPKKESLF